jgi:2'-5' RNA ligase
VEPLDRSRAELGTQSALVVLVPEVESIVEGWRERLDPSSQLGVPAHLTLLFPFVPPHDIDDTVRADLSRVMAEVAAFDFALDAVGWFDDEVVWLRPSPAAPFAELTERIADRWPEYPPYEGAFDEVVHHLTIGDGADLELMRRAADDVQRHLPVRSRAREVHLLVGNDRPGSWMTSEAFALRQNG